jgi:hypothetical protein
MFASCSETMRPYKLAYFGLLLELQRQLQLGTVDSSEAYGAPLANRMTLLLTNRLGRATQSTAISIDNEDEHKTVARKSTCRPAVQW